MMFDTCYMDHTLSSKVIDCKLNEDRALFVSVYVPGISHNSWHTVDLHIVSVE